MVGMIFKQFARWMIVLMLMGIGDMSIDKVSPRNAFGTIQFNEPARIDIAIDQIQEWHESVGFFDHNAGMNYLM